MFILPSCCPVVAVLSPWTVVYCRHDLPDLYFLLETLSHILSSRDFVAKPNPAEFQSFSDLNEDHGWILTPPNHYLRCDAANHQVVMVDSTHVHLDSQKKLHFSDSQSWHLVVVICCGPDTQLQEGYIGLLPKSGWNLTPSPMFFV